MIRWAGWRGRGRSERTSDMRSRKLARSLEGEERRGATGRAEGPAAVRSPRGNRALLHHDGVAQHSRRRCCCCTCACGVTDEEGVRADTLEAQASQRHQRKTELVRGPPCIQQHVLCFHSAPALPLPQCRSYCKTKKTTTTGAPHGHEHVRRFAI